MRFFILKLMILTAVTVTFLGPVLTGCALYSPAPDQLELELALPQWPPQDSFSQEYPELSRWLVQVSCAEYSDAFYTTKNSITVKAKRNRPLCVTAKPITLLYDNNESDYFKPAGFMFPFSDSTAGETGYSLTWEQGYLAEVMLKLFQKGEEEGFPPVEIEYLVSTFNWKKAQETIQSKIEGSTDAPTETTEALSGNAASATTPAPTPLFYNPWLLPQAEVLEAITTHNFKTSVLSLTGCAALTTEQLKLPSMAQNPGTTSAPQLLSSFIPENIPLLQKNQFTVMKNSPIMISDGKKLGVFVTYKSAKNISLEFIYLPIYIEDI